MFSITFCFELFLSTAGVCWSLTEDGEWVINLRKIDPPSSIQGGPPIGTPPGPPKTRFLTPPGVRPPKRGSDPPNGGSRDPPKRGVPGPPYSLSKTD